LPAKSSQPKAPPHHTNHHPRRANIRIINQAIIFPNTRSTSPTCLPSTAEHTNTKTTGTMSEGNRTSVKSEHRGSVKANRKSGKSAHDAKPSTGDQPEPARLDQELAVTSSDHSESASNSHSEPVPVNNTSIAPADVNLEALTVNPQETPASAVSDYNPTHNLRTIACIYLLPARFIST
jgi:hypothetical protein